MKGEVKRRKWEKEGWGRQSNGINGKAGVVFLISRAKGDQIIPLPGGTASSRTAKTKMVL